MTQETVHNKYHNHFDNRLEALLDSKTLNLLDDILKETRKEMFEPKLDSAIPER
jgi:hypothetical protein